MNKYQRMAVRRPLYLVGIVSLGIGITLLAEGRYHPMFAYLAVAIVVIVTAVALGRQGFLQKPDRLPNILGLLYTKDYDIDPETGHLIETRFNSITGQERHRDLGDVNGKAHR